jgi:hypothetical protein
LPGEPERVRLELEVLARVQLGDGGAVRKLPAAEWQQRSQRLQMLDRFQRPASDDKVTR